MLRDVLVLAIEKGQFPLAVNGLLLILVVLKFSAHELTALVVSLLDAFERGWVLGYVAAAVLAASCFLRSRKRGQLS